ncbi:MAG: DNA repair protein RecN [Ruminococcaceae bacterium]|nr:DNA repair protein RecN [Oscillospiraceae bacterium]
MLESLHIENMAVISRLDVDFREGFSVITGESGSGKSVMIDCILFLLGGKPARDLVRVGAEKGTVSATFSDIGEECLCYLRENGLEECEELLLQRTLTAEGKSQARLNGRILPLSMLRGLAKYLVSVHGQNENQLLLQKPAQERILDSISVFGDTLDAYRRLYAERTAAKEALKGLNRDSAEINRLRDILTFQIKEIDAAHLKAGEEEELLARRVKLQNAERIATQANFTYRVLHGSEKGAATLILERAAQSLAQISHVIPEAGELSTKLSEMRYEVEDIANTVRDYAEDTDGDPTKALDKVEGRLNTITKLCRKYGADIPAVLQFREEAFKRLNTLENADGEIERLEGAIRAAEERMRALSLLLHEARLKAARELGARVCEELTFLDMPGVRFAITVERTAEFGPHGEDEICFAIATNPGEPLLPLEKIASGGELSRVMLALKSVLNDRDGVRTAVFDEVDTGISGKTARKIGIKLSEIGRRTQILCVTHSAQVASLATVHYKIAKSEKDGRSESAVWELNDAARVDEVARILGGLSVTEAQRVAAGEMIEEGKCYR